MNTPIKPRFIPLPFQESADAGRVILRDGSTAEIHQTSDQDMDLLEAFFKQLSAESRLRRFFTVAMPAKDLLQSFCDNSDPHKAVTLAVTRLETNNKRIIIAVGSYLAIDDKTVEMAFAVDDAAHGKGLGSLLLERLALLAVRNGFRQCWAVTHAENTAMREVFRNSGFEVKEKQDGNEIEVDLSLVPTQESVAQSEFRDRVATVASLHPFFRPNAVAVVGASNKPNSIGFRLLDGLLQGRFNGPVYPINPKSEVLGCIRAYPSVKDLPEQVDLAIIAVPKQAVLSVIDDCAAKGVLALIVITAGFAEIRGEGQDLQEQLLKKVRGYGMRLVGPNCLGLQSGDPSVRLNASFSTIFPPFGKVAMLSQSGALGLAILAAAVRLQLGLSSFVSVGNKADVSGNDLLQYWEEDENTNVILLYLESFGNPRRFARIARRVSQKKPIIALKGGRTKVGSRAAGSHTAALGANNVAVEALFEQSGVIRADSLEGMFDLATAFAHCPLPQGPRVGIVTNAGGPGILCADECEARGLELPEFSTELQKKLAESLPPTASLGNPVDMIASATPEQYQEAVRCLLASDEVDSLIVIYIPVGLTDNEAIARALKNAISAAGTNKPVLGCLMNQEGVPPPIEVESGKIPLFEFPEAAARVLGKVNSYAEWRRKPEGIIPDFDDLDVPGARAICQQAISKRGGGWLSAEETRLVLSSFGAPLAAGGVSQSPEEAVEIAKSVGFPVAVKLTSTTLVHKTEVGGVLLNLKDADSVQKAFEKIRGHLAETNQLDAMEGILVQQMIPEGTEVMVGVTQDPLFGPLIAFGMGGIHVEILGDVCFRVTPLTGQDASEMVRSIRGYKLLQGYRGKPAADIPALEDLLLRISRMVEEIPEITELDLNPAFALPPGQGCRIVDARIRVKNEAG